MGSVLILSWPFVLIVLLGCLILFRRWLRARAPSGLLVCVLGIFVAGQLAWVGLHGSRLSTLGGVFIAAGFSHYLIRRFRTRVVLIGVLAALGFSFAYSFYKGAGRLGVVTALSGEGGLSQMERYTGRDAKWLLLGDLARADIQMEELWTMYEANTEYSLKLGQTYVGAALFIPRRLWPTRPRGPQEAYAELQGGHIGVRPGEIPNSRVFGLTGETLLNFGWAGVPVAHAVLGMLIAFVGRFVSRLREGDVRLVFAPLLTMLVMSLYILDLSNVVFMFLQDCAVLTACTGAALWGSTRNAPAVARWGRPSNVNPRAPRELRRRGR